MSFVRVPGPHYVKRTLVFVNSYDRVPSASVDGYEFTWALEEEIQQVFSIELVQYSIPRNVVSTYLGQVDTFRAIREGVTTLANTQSNMVVDMKLVDETGTQSVILTGTLDPLPGTGLSYSGGRLNLPEEIRQATFDMLSVALSNSTHPLLNNTNYNIEVVLDDNNIMTITAPNQFALTYANVELLFGSGPNRLKQSSVPMGFPPFQDTGSGMAVNNLGALGSFAVNLHPFRYLDVSIREANEFKPVARIYALDEDQDDYVNPCDLPKRCRIMEKPIRNMKTMGIKIRGERGLNLSFYGQTGIYLTFELLSIAQVPKVPSWVIQRLNV